MGEVGGAAREAPRVVARPTGVDILWDGPVHVAFGLTYASYLVWPRVLMTAMPLDWQERFVALADEFSDAWTQYEPQQGYRVQRLGARGRFVRDPLGNYRHPDLRLLSSLRAGSSDAALHAARAADPSTSSDGEPEAAGDGGRG